MLERRKLFLLIFCQLLSHGCSSKLLLQMPSVRPQAESNLCQAHEVEEDRYITKFTPLVKPSSHAHHMILYACDNPGYLEDVWDCGEMIISSSSNDSSSYKPGPVCEDSRIIYAWAMDAPALNLPKDVSFEVGGTNGPRYVVLQVHYKKGISYKDEGDTSGVLLTTASLPTKKLAGIYLIYSEEGKIPPGQTELSASCTYNEEPVLHPFAYRVHAHTHGVKITGKVIKNKFVQTIGQRSPQLPQMFELLANKSLTIEKGNKLTAECEMNNKENKIFKIGPKSSDEMCNFYIMYWVDGGRLPQSYLCPDPTLAIEENNAWAAAAVKDPFESSIEKELYPNPMQDDDSKMVDPIYKEDSLLPIFPKTVLSKIVGDDQSLDTFKDESLANDYGSFGVFGNRKPWIESESDRKFKEESYVNGKQIYSNQNSEHNRYSNTNDRK